MKTLNEKIEAVRREFDKNIKPVTALNLIKYPEDTLGRQLGKFLLKSNYGQNVCACHDDVLQLLIEDNYSFTSEIAVQYYLLGNGCFGLRRLCIMALGLGLLPHKASYFYKKYKEGKTALRFYDIDHLSLLHLPLKQVKETFLIK